MLVAVVVLVVCSSPSPSQTAAEEVGQRPLVQVERRKEGVDPLV